MTSWLFRQFARTETTTAEYAARSQTRSDAIVRGLAQPKSDNVRAIPRVPNPSPFRVSVHRTINDVDGIEWDAIIGRNGLLRSHAYLAAVEASASDDRVFFYPVFRRADGKIVAHACIYLVDTDLAQLLPRWLQWFPQLIRRLWFRFLIVRITECASPMSTSHSISVSPEIDQREFVISFSDTLTTTAKEHGSSLIVVRDFLTGDRFAFDELLTHGFNLVSNMPVARIKVRWRTYEEYLDNMRSRYRKDIKRRIKRATASGQHVRVLKCFAKQAELWVAQARTVQQSTKGFKRENLSVEYYENMDRMLSDKSVLVAAERDGQPVAHGMILKDDSVSIATYFGRNPGPAAQEWFHLVNEVIKLGIEDRCEYINLGLGSYDAKSNVGAELEPLFVYSKSTYAPVNWFMRAVPHLMDCSNYDLKQIFKS
jgi:predicted N-acyltransferase